MIYTIANLTKVVNKKIDITHQIPVPAQLQWLANEPKQSITNSQIRIKAPKRLAQNNK